MNYPTRAQVNKNWRNRFRNSARNQSSGCLTITLTHITYSFATNQTTRIWRIKCDSHWAGKKGANALTSVPRNMPVKMSD